jgi:hypothetical protein
MVSTSARLRVVAWHALSTLAHVLLHKQRLQGDEVVDIVERAYTPPHQPWLLSH